MIGRGEHAEIITFVGRTVDPNFGSRIDLCTVGASLQAVPLPLVSGS